MSVCRMSTMLPTGKLSTSSRKSADAFGRQQSVGVDAPVAAIAQLEIATRQRPARPTGSTPDAASSRTRCRSGTSGRRAAAPCDSGTARSRPSRCIRDADPARPRPRRVRRSTRRSTRTFTVSNAKPIALTLSASTPTASFACGVRAFIHAYSLLNRRTKLPRATTFSPLARPRRSNS